MSDFKIVTESAVTDGTDVVGGALPVPATEGMLTRRDLDMIKRDLITVRKDYNEIRENMMVLTHQHSSAPSRSFFVVGAVVWLVLMAALLVAQPQLSEIATRLLERLHHL